MILEEGEGGVGILILLAPPLGDFLREGVIWQSLGRLWPFYQQASPRMFQALLPLVPSDLEMVKFLLILTVLTDINRHCLCWFPYLCPYF